MQKGKSKVMIAPYPKGKLKRGNVIVAIPGKEVDVKTNKMNQVDHTIGLVVSLGDDKIFCVVPGTGGEEKFAISYNQAFLPILAIKQERNANDTGMQIETLACSINARQFKVALANLDKTVEWEMSGDGAVITKYGAEVTEDGVIPFNPEELYGMTTKEVESSNIDNGDKLKRLMDEVLGKKGKKFNKGVAHERKRVVKIIELIREANRGATGESDDPQVNVLGAGLDKVLLAALSQIAPEDFGKFDFEAQTKALRKEMFGDSDLSGIKAKELVLEDVKGQPTMKSIVLKMYRSLEQL